MSNRIRGRGWLQDLPDPRDYTCRKKIICQMYKRLGVENIKDVEPPKCTDLRKWCSPIEDQSGFNSCTAHAGVGLVEFFVKKAYDRDKVSLSLELPLMFGFNTYTSIDEVSREGKIPFPSESESFAEGHAVVAVGYDDDVEIENWRDGQKTTGALLIRNSWGEGWGDGGYGWLPYEYVLRGFTSDWWSLLCNEWIDTDQFGLLPCDPSDSEMEVKND